MRGVATPWLAVVVFGAAACTYMPGSSDTADDTPVKAERTFPSGGSLEMTLAGGRYEIQPSADDHIRVTTSGHTGSTKVDITTSEKSGTVTVSDTPHNNFHAVIEVPKTTDLVVKLTAGDLTIAPIIGNADVNSGAGNVTIEVTDPANYSSVDATVKAGDIKGGPFGESKSGLMPHLTWSGKGTHTLRASLGAGNLTLTQ